MSLFWIGSGVATGFTIIDNRRVVVPYHGDGATIPYGTLKGIITDLEWTIKDLKRLKLT